jgi:multiple sugar transport system permease protein
MELQGKWSWALHYFLLAVFVIFALFPLFWLLKVSITPNDLLYGEGVRLWPSRSTVEHYASVIAHSQFPLFFRNSVIVAATTAIFSTLLATAAGYGFSRFQFRGKYWIVGLMLVTQMFPLVMIAC